MKRGCAKLNSFAVVKQKLKQQKKKLRQMFQNEMNKSSSAHSG